MAKTEKPAFDPNKKFEAVSEKPAFDPNAKSEPLVIDQKPSLITPAFASRASLVTPNINPEYLAAFKEGGKQGLTLNYANTDQAIMDKAPRAALAGQVLGSIPPAIAISTGLGALGAAASGPLISAVSKFAPKASAAITALGETAAGTGLKGWLARMAGTGATSAAQGGIQGGLTNPNEGGSRIENAKEGALIGAVAGPVMQTVAEAPGAIKAGLSNLAQTEAFKALNPSKTKDVIKLVQEGKAPKIGQTLRDTGVVRGIPTTNSGIANRVNTALEESGETFGKFIDDIAAHADDLNKSRGSSQNLPMVAQPKIGISRKAIADHLEQELIDAHQGIPTLEDQAAKMQKLITRFREGGDEFVSIKDAQRLKTAIGKKINWKRLPNEDIPDDEVFNRAIYYSFNKGVEDAADVASQSLGGDFARKFKDIKQQYANLKQAATIANRSSVGEYTNRFISPSDYGVGLFSTFASAGNPVVAVGASLLNKGARTFGNQIVSNAANLGSKAIPENLTRTLNQATLLTAPSIIGTGSQLNAIQRRAPDAGNR